MSLGSIFGKSAKSTSSSNNQAYPFIKDQYSGAVGTGNSAMSTLGALLGIGGDTNAANNAFNNYLDSTGYNFALNQGSKAITGNAAARGLLQSGATGQALTKYGQNLGQNYFQNYLQNVSGLANQGLQAGNLIAGAGSQSQSKNRGGSGGLLGAAAGIGSLFSDRRLKTDIEKVGELDDGLGVYRYKMFGNGESVTGVMADEVEKLRPWAMAEPVHGFARVNYDKLERVE